DERRLERGVAGAVAGERGVVEVGGRGAERVRRAVVDRGVTAGRHRRGWSGARGEREEGEGGDPHRSAAEVRSPSMVACTVWIAACAVSIAGYADGVLIASRNGSGIACT